MRLTLYFSYQDMNFSLFNKVCCIHYQSSCLADKRKRTEQLTLCFMLYTQHSSGRTARVSQTQLTHFPSREQGVSYSKLTSVLYCGEVSQLKLTAASIVGYKLVSILVRNAHSQIHFRLVPSTTKNLQKSILFNLAIYFHILI